MMGKDKAGRATAAGDRLPPAPEGTGGARADLGMGAGASKALQPLVFSSGGQVRDGRGGAAARGAAGGAGGKDGGKKQAGQA